MLNRQNNYVKRSN